MIWKKIDEFPYEVSDTGLVRRSTTKRIRKLDVAGNGYLRIMLKNNKVKRHTSVHILVLETFLGPCPENMEAAHIDGDQRNNTIGNLAWKTHLDNIKDKYVHGTMPVGERHHAALLTDVDYAAIIASDETHRQVANRYHIKRSTVAGIRYRARQQLRRADAEQGFN